MVALVTERSYEQETEGFVERVIAETLVRLSISISELLNVATLLIRGEPDRQVQVDARRGIASVGVALNDGILRPIIRQYPDLDPDREQRQQ